jgi:hypothetical protein
MNKVSLRKEGYKFYRSKGGVADNKKYVEVTNAFMKAVRDHLLSGKQIKVHYLGIIEIVGAKTKIKLNNKGHVGNVNWPDTKELWNKCEECKENKQFVYFLNEHSGSIYYRVLSNKRFYNFKPNFTFRKMLTALIHKGKEYKNDKVH